MCPHRKHVVLIKKYLIFLCVYSVFSSLLVMAMVVRGNNERPNSSRRWQSAENEIIKINTIQCDTGYYTHTRQHSRCAILRHRSLVHNSLGIAKEKITFFLLCAAAHFVCTQQKQLHISLYMIFISCERHARHFFVQSV